MGLSAVGKAWLPRRTLAGTYDDDWLKNQWPLPPKDFDDAYWNCAPADQQVPHLPAATQILLLHIDVKSSNPKDAKPSGHSGTWQGSLSTSWPCVRLWVAPAGHSDENAQRWEQAMALDTLCIQPNQGLVVATYRYRIAQRSLGDAQLIAIAQWVANNQRVKSRGLWPQKDFAPELLQPAKMPAN